MSGAPAQASALFAGRYRVEQTLGQGGTGVVERVTDVRSGRQLALKRLLKARPTDGSRPGQSAQSAQSAQSGQSDDQRRSATVTLLFQREYHVLSQLSHPNIIDVHDYAVDQGEPYYTMELLDGSDLREMAPMPWRPACEILLDVCSALALLHSRGLVHRDLTPRNVRRTADGRVKLIDFGAMTAMGQPAEIVGTPPYMAPELVHGQVLDGRADLFALGAVAYWLLTGRHAFPARTISQLRDVWRSAPSRITGLAPDVPPGLEQLIIRLLSIDALSRPRSAGEVVQRLCAFIEREAVVLPSAAQAYLTTPMLVGRGAEQVTFRKRALSCNAGRGAHISVLATAGLGRSRLLDAFALEGKLAGLTVARVRATGLPNQDHAALGSLVRALLDALPEDIELGEAEQAVLSRLPAALRNPTAVQSSALSEQEQQDVLDRWLLGVARRHGLLLLLDDSETYDAASLLVLARWARRTPDSRLLMISSVNTANRPQHTKAHQRLIEGAEQMPLQPLQREDNFKLLSSLFGDVAQLRPVADWTYRLSGGNPRVTMDLAQHLVDRGIARLADGDWKLPDTLDALSLPDSLQQALHDRILQLPAAALQLAQGLSLVTAHAPLDLSEYATLTGSDHDPAQLFAALDMLVACHVLTRTGDSYMFHQQSVAEIVRSSLKDDQRRKLHLRLAQIYRESKRDGETLVAYHCYWGGEPATAFAVLQNSDANLTQLGGLNSHLLRSAEGIDLFERCLVYAKDSGKPEREQYFLRRWLLRLGASADPTLARHIDDVLPSLTRLVGLTHWDSTDAALDPAQRIGLCLQHAMAEYEATPEAERWLHPFKAVEEFAHTLAMLSSTYACTWNAERIVQLPEMLRPLRALSPVLAFLCDACELSAATIVRGNQVLVRRRQLFAQLQTGVPGMSELVRSGTINLFHFYLGLDESVFGSPSALEHAEALQKQPYYAGLGWLVRMFYHLHRGEYRASEDARVQMELHALRNLDHDQHFTAGLVFEATLLARYEDLLGFKRLLPAFTAHAARFPGWRPWEAYVHGYYALLRGETDKAMELLAQVRSAMEPCKHGSWFHLRVLEIKVLLAQDRAEAAVAAADALEAALAEHNVQPTASASYLVQVALALGRVGRHEEACMRLETLINHGRDDATSPMVQAGVYAARARLAMYMTDIDAFHKYAALADALVRPGGHPAGRALIDRLMNDARQLPGLQKSADVVQQSEEDVHYETIQTRVSGLRARLMTSDDPKERARHALAILVDESNARGGYLFVFAGSGLTHAASVRPGVPVAQITEVVQRYLEHALGNTAQGDEEVATATASDPDTETQTPGTTSSHAHRFVGEDGGHYLPLLLRTYEGNRPLAVGVLVLRGDKDQELRAPWMLLSALAHALLEAGDART